MRHRSVAVLAAAALCAGAATAGAVVGYYEATPDIGGARNRLCVTQSPEGKVAVTVAPAHCGSRLKQCPNVRFDERSFVGRLNQHNVLVSSDGACRVRIAFTSRGAIVSHGPACMDDEHPYFLARGKYGLVRRAVQEKDCGV
jgi:hypothetical protein